MKRNFRFLLLSSLLVGLSAFGMACGENLDDTCTLDADGTEIDASECTDGKTADDADCTCEEAPADECTEDADCADGEVCNDAGACEAEEGPACTEDTDCADGQVCENDACVTPEDPAFRFVMVEDLTANPSGDFPGADVDAISVVKASGDEIFAETFEEDTDIDATGNLAADASALLGAPDAVDDGGTCFGGGAPDGSLFTALNGGFVIVQFSSVANGDVTIENGDDIHVYEVGATECGRFDDDPFKVSVSVADDVTGDFKEVGEGGNGSNIVPVSGL